MPEIPFDIATLLESPIPWLIGLFLITFFGNGTIPVPLSIYVIGLGHFQIPLIVTLIGAIGTTLGWIFIGGPIAQKLTRKAPERFIRRVPKSYQHILLRWPKWSVFLFNAVPFPIDIVRLFAIANGTAPKDLALPLFFGRLVRYAILVYTGGFLMQYKQFFWLLTGLILLPFITGLFKKRPKPEAQKKTEPMDSHSN